jgi:O-antigen/teichoic acid export membrane protein
MEGVKRALAASIFSRGWSAVLGVLAVPLYLRYLGVEAYGIVGMFASLTALMSFLDLGLGATLTRELARLPVDEGRLPYGRDITRTFELVYALVALLMGLALAACSSALAEHWLTVQTLDRAEIAWVLMLAGGALACQWPTNLYSSGLAGAHRQIQLGVATTIFGTLRVLITLVAVWWHPSLESFFWAQILAALLQTLGLRVLLWKALALTGHNPIFRLASVASSLRFAGGMTGIAITSIVLTQTDKVILSRALSLTDFGVYVVANTLAAGIYMLIGPMFSVIYPRFSSLVHTGETNALIELYHTSSQLMSALVIPVAVVFAGFSREILYVWTGDLILSQQGASILALLIIGNASNGIMNMPYALQLAAGWTKLALWVNVGAIIVLVPAIWWGAMHYGAVGGAAVWAILNFSYIVFTPQIMHRRLLPSEKKAWYIYDVVLPAVICVAALILLRQISLAGIQRVTMALIILGYLALVSAVTMLGLPRVRARMFLWLKFRFSWLGVRRSCE